MGYDIHMLRYPTEYLGGYEPQDTDDPTYWRFVSRGMSAMLNIMANLEIVDQEIPCPELPDWPPEGISEERAEELEEWAFTNEGDTQPTGQEVSILGPWKAQRETVLSASSPVASRVPWYKFASNDGWIVLPDEARLIASAVRAATGQADFIAAVAVHVQDSPEEITSWMNNWAAYNDTAAMAGGYRVQ